MSEMPELRSGPPWAMEEMILRRARAASRRSWLRTRRRLEAAESIRETRDRSSITGCGTGEHAAMAGAALPRRARAATPSRPRSTRSDEGVLIAISHEAGTAADARRHEGRPERAHDPDHAPSRTSATGADLDVAHAARRHVAGATPSATSRRCSR